MTTNWPPRFREKVRVGAPDECWEWTAAKARGYGKIKIGRAIKQAHRLSWSWANGQEPPPDLCVLHRCDNRACVNPQHLFLGTFADNSADMVAKGRQARGERMSELHRGELSGKAKITAEQAQAIRADQRPQHEIAAQYGIAPTAVSKIKRRETWRYIGDDA